MPSVAELLNKIEQGDHRAIARAISMVENELAGSDDCLLSLNPNQNIPVIGITGPPGAGKSTLINALLLQWTNENKKIAVLSVDPSSPFNYGALLGDRIRMNDFYLHPNVFIRSLASRGALGGLSPKIIEISDVLRACPFDVILIETVGVGQSEVEIAGLADTTIVVMVPEAGDEVQTMKAGVMEIADIFVVNKGDRANADEFVTNLRHLAHSKANDWEIPVVKCISTSGEGIDTLAKNIGMHHNYLHSSASRRLQLLTEKAYVLIQQERMKDLSKHKLESELATVYKQADFNIYRFVKKIAGKNEK